MTDEFQILEQALAALETTTGIHGDIVLEPRLGTGQAKDPGYDALVRLERDGFTQTFAAQCKTWMNTAAAALAVTKLRTRLPGVQLNHPYIPLLVTGYVTNALAERLKELRINFIDTAGNAYIDLPGFFILIAGKRHPLLPAVDRVERLFKPAGLRILFGLLCQDGLVIRPYREIARQTGAALGAVHWAFKDLKRLGCLAETKAGKRVLTRRKELLEKWVTAYAGQLRPKLLLDRYEARDTFWWQTAVLPEGVAQWGGETAGALLTNYLKPAIATIYAEEPLPQFIAQYRLRKTPTGNVELRKRFWHFETTDKRKDAVPPLLVYADLMATAEGRNVETAKIIYEEHLARLVSEA